NFGNRVNNVNDAQPGDLIFFSESGQGTADHVAMYMGGGQIIVADTTGTPVRIRPLDANERIVGINRYPGVISTTDPQSGPVSYNVPTGVFGGSSGASLPVARPSFDWWSGLGISSPGVQAGQENVGLIYSFIKNDPDLQNLYSEAVAGNWSQDEFVRHLQETDWWKNNSDTVRQNLATKATDPAAWNQQLQNDKAKVQEMAISLGVHLSDAALQNITNTAALMGYNDATIQKTLSTYLQQSSAGWFGGYAGQVELGLKEYAADQGIPLSQDYINNSVKSIVAGTSSLQDQRAIIQTQAAAAFPAYANEINQGMTVGQIAAPFVNTVTGILEQNPDSVDLFNPILRKALQFKDAAGNPVPMSLSDFEVSLRKTPQWRATNNARESAMSVGSKVLQD
ncbi:MAG TPA: NlpC/P60 family protein, partial [Ktedonobacteraceae bacterium]|nr:NlpC/P60 family protein [Ktedonobacteraceae bacterium]